MPSVGALPARSCTAEAYKIYEFDKGRPDPSWGIGGLEPPKMKRDVSGAAAPPAGDWGGGSHPR